MVASFLSLTHIINALENDGLVLVPNNRLRNQLIRAYGALHANQKAIATPNIKSTHQWIAEQWQQLQAKAHPDSCVVIASNMHRQLIWERVIQQTLGKDNPYLQVRPLAQQADSAFKNLQLWNLTEADINPDHSTIAISQNTQQFVVWMKQFTEDLARQNTITHETSMRIITQAFHDGFLQKINTIHLEGFDDIPPLQQTLLYSAAENIIRLPNQESQNNKVARIELATEDEEMRAAATWAKQLINEHTTNVYIGLVVPNLGQCREKMERILVEVFEPISFNPLQPRYTLPFNFSAGKPLGGTPLIKSIFQILNLHSQKMPLTEVCNLVQSPFWGDMSGERVIRTHIVFKLRELKQLTLSAGDLRYASSYVEKKINVSESISIRKRFEDLGNLFREAPSRQNAQGWLQLINSALDIIGWPGSRRLDSQEYQQIKQWHSVCDEFTAIDFHSAPISFGQAFSLLQQIADKTPFQAQTPDSPIQVLGALEAAGLQFSHLWVMGMNDNQWPPAPAPNPLLPLTLQRQHNMPHASAERELEIAQGLTNRYRKSAHQVIFSSAHVNDAIELRPSALVRDIPLTNLPAAEFDSTSLASHYKDIIESSALEIIPDQMGPCLQPNETVRGGTRLFQLQAICPFSAFAELRLGAREIDLPSIGFTPAERGNLLHESLASLWHDIKTSSALKSISETELKDQVNKVTSAVIQNTQTKNPKRLGKNYCALEQLRLSALLCEWLELEKLRPDFSVIGVELESDIHFMSLKLNVRLDRVDLLSDGSKLIVDYKTGNASSKNWQGERLTEPQLPLYTVAQTNDHVAAVSYAIINRKQMKWDGVGESKNDNSEVFPTGIKSVPDWAEIKEAWNESLQKLAQDFIAGKASVDFVDKQSQSYAEHLLPLNRLKGADAVYAFSQVLLSKEQAE